MLSPLLPCHSPRRQRCGIKESASFRTFRGFFVGVIGILFIGSVSTSQASSVGEFDVLAINPIEKLDESIDYLRHDDERLIRFDVPSDEAKERQERFCSKHLLSLVTLISTRSEPEFNMPLEDQVKVVRIITLCSGEHPEYRKQIGGYKEGMALKAILSMLDESDAIADIVVGEAVWVLSFNDKHNHNFFIENGAVEKMGNLIVQNIDDLEEVEGDELDEEDSAILTLSVMWLAAGLQNLAASYCGTDTGHCWWEYDEPDEESGNEGRIRLHEDSPLSIDGSGAAKLIAEAADGQLAEILQDFVCDSKIGEENVDHWPTLAKMSNAMEAASDFSLATWAFAGVLKNLSMYEGSKKVVEEARGCLCELARSEDWLESSKAGEALTRIGVTEEECMELQEEHEENYEEFEDEEPEEL